MKAYEIILGGVIMLVSLAVIGATLVVKNDGKGLSGVFGGASGQTTGTRQNPTDARLNKVIVGLTALNAAAVVALNIIVAHFA